ncbi:MAG TPA: YjbQ family protein [Hellea balneolensis]|uniref:YjbQ family protein n=1 Tax=Hellea balneolensis TaxID=287478 RepID=A0A7C5QP29_9PROT|nr:YjbQ family protein [Hellea balneolensis]
MQTRFTITTQGQGLYEFTHRVRTWVDQGQISQGLLTLFVRHTSCSLLITENADPDVILDMRDFYATLVPENMPGLRHICEGPDDMPAHIKAALSPVSLSIPVMDGAPALGTWQGLFLFEHRKRTHRREIVAHLQKDDNV